MKKRPYLRLLPLLLAIVLLAGCSSATKPLPEAEDVQGNLIFTIPKLNPDDFIHIVTMPTIPDPSPEAVSTAKETGLENLVYVRSDTVSSDIAPVKYVLIYNPSVRSSSFLSTGNLGSQIKVDLNKGGLEEEDAPSFYDMTVSQDELSGNIPIEELIKDGSKAGAIITPYKVGDTKTFYCFDSVSLNNPRITRKFTCKYAGTNCNIWVSGAKISSKLIKSYGKQFDTYIYQTVVDTFGPSRFAKNGGKVNLLYYPMPTGIGGCFTTADLFALGEVTPSEVAIYGINTDHDILNLNASLVGVEGADTFMRSTMAHEFQHLICATNAYDTPNLTRCPTWFNEAMSGYIEEVLFPGVKAEKNGHLSDFSKSYLIRNGQSLYNFLTYPDDIGVYGSVYLFSEYLANLAGDDIFSTFHRYWRTSYSPTLSGAEALARSLPQKIKIAVDECTGYPASITFNTKEEEILSKLTLQFYLELLSKNDSDPKNFSKVKPKKLLYNQTTPALIEGGGRIIVALQGDTFTVPSDADDGLIYVGLDQNFTPIARIYNMP